MDDHPQGHKQGGDWAETLDDLDDRQAQARAMGGAERLARRHAEGRLDARGRVAALVDDGTFREIGTLAGPVPADAIVAGVAAIDGRPVAVGAEDFTVMGGSIGPAATRKRWRLADIAARERIPLVMLLEGAGHRPPTKGDTRGGGPNDLQAQARLSGRVPMVCGVMGPSAGHGAITALLSDFSVMTPDAAIFTAGPPVVKASLGEDTDKMSLGGPDVAIPAGTVHNLASGDADLLGLLRRYLSYFGSSAWEHPPWRDTGDTAARACDEILGIVPRDNRRAYDMGEVIAHVVDNGEMLAVQPGYGPSLLCGLARIGGHAVGVVANQPAVMAGAIDTAAADKGAHFISVCDSFHLPLVFLTDNPGLLSGTVSERAGVLRGGGRMFAAQTRATTVKVQITMRKAFGFGSCVMAMNPYDEQTLSFGYPGATLGAFGSQGAGLAVGADEETSRQLRQAESESSYRAAQALSFDDLIDPRHTRNALLDALNASARRRQHQPEPKSRVGINP